MLGIFHDSADVFVLKVRDFFVFLLLLQFDDDKVSSFFSFNFSTSQNLFPFFFFFFFSLPEQDIEKIAPKRGVVLQAVKDVLQGLVDEDLVHCEKIGISNFFW